MYLNGGSPTNGTQLYNDKVKVAGTASTIVTTGTTALDLATASHTHGNITNDGKLGTASRVVITDGSKNITTDSNIDTTELSYLNGVSSNIQTQIDGKMKRGTYERIEGTTSAHKDLNNYYTPGFYNVKGLYTDNCPLTTDTDYYLMVMPWNKDKWTTQFLISGNGTPNSGKMWYRTTTNGTATTWGGWVRAASASELPSASSTTPSDLGTAAVGTSTAYARADHVHKKPTASDIGAAPTSHAVDASTYGWGSKSVAGHLKVGSNITVSDGTISLTKTDVTSALGYTPPTSNTDTLMTQSVSTANATYPILACPTADATANQGAKTGIFASSVELNPSTGNIVFTKASGGISYKGTKSTYNMIRFVDNTGDTFGNGIIIGGGGLVSIGGGESATTIAGSESGGLEELRLGSDGVIRVYTNVQSNSTTVSTFNTDGTFTPKTSGSVASNNGNAVTGGVVYTAIQNLKSEIGTPMHYKGAWTSNNSWPSNPATGDTYRATVNGSIDNVPTWKAGDTLVYGESAWDIIPSGDEPTGTVIPSGTITNGHIAVFDGTSGNVIKDGGATSQFQPAGTYLTLYNNASNLSTIAGWGTLTSTNGYTHLAGVAQAAGGSNGELRIATKSGQVSVQVDGYYYQNEGKYQVIDTTTTQSLTNKTYNGYTLAAACAKGVDTSIANASSSASLPTSAAVAAFVEGKGYTTLSIGTTSTTAAAGDHTHAISLESGGATTFVLSHGGTYTLTAGGSSVIFKMPNDDNTHYTANLITGASATAQSNAANTTTNSIFLNLVENSTVRNSHNIVGSGGTTVACDANGKITITSPSLGTGASNAAKGNHTHTASLTAAGSSGTTLAHNTWYTLTAGGSSVIFKTPADNNTDIYVKQIPLTTDNTYTYPLLASATASATTETTTTSVFCPNIQLRPLSTAITLSLSGTIGWVSPYGLSHSYNIDSTSHNIEFVRNNTIPGYIISANSNGGSYSKISSATLYEPADADCGVGYLAAGYVKAVHRGRRSTFTMPAATTRCKLITIANGDYVNNNYTAHMKFRIRTAVSNPYENFTVEIHWSGAVSNMLIYSGNATVTGSAPIRYVSSYVTKTLSSSGHGCFVMVENGSTTARNMIIEVLEADIPYTVETGTLAAHGQTDGNFNIDRLEAANNADRTIVSSGSMVTSITGNCSGSAGSANWSYYLYNDYWGTTGEAITSGQIIAKGSDGKAYTLKSRTDKVFALPLTVGRANSAFNANVNCAVQHQVRNLASSALTSMVVDASSAIGAPLYIRGSLDSNGYFICDGHYSSVMTNGYTWVQIGSFARTVNNWNLDASHIQHAITLNSSGKVTHVDGKAVLDTTYTVNNGTLTIKGGSTTATTFTANSSTSPTLTISGSRGTTVTAASGTITVSSPQIYSSTSAPTSSDGSNGDIWIQYTA